MLKRKTNIFVTILFAFVAFMFIGTTNVNAETVEVSTEAELIAALDGRKKVGDVNVSDTDTTLVKLTDNITLAESLVIRPITDLTLDLNGYTIDGEINKQSVGITYGSNDLQDFTSGSLTIKDSSTDKDGTIKSWEQISIKNYNTDASTKDFKLTIEGGNFYVIDFGRMFELSNSDFYMKDKNITFEFQVNDGYFEVNGDIFLHAGDIVSKGITLNVNFDKLIFKCPNARLVYSSEKDFTVNDVVSADSKIRLKYTVILNEAELIDRTVSVTALDALRNKIGFYFDTIEITKADGFDVSDVTLTETYGYTTATPVDISIKNRGTNSLQIKNVTVSEESSKFDVVLPDHDVTVSPNVTDTSYQIKAHTGLGVGTYTGTITVTDINDKTYTSDVTLTVSAKELTGLGISGVDSEITYGDTYNPSLTGTSELTSADYTITYAKKVGENYSDIDSKPTDVGEYKVTITVTNANYTANTHTATFKIVPKTITPTVSTIADQTYTGAQIIPDISVSYGDTPLTENTDYTVEYATNENVAEGGKVTIKPVSESNYTFSNIDKTFNIVAKALTDSDVILTQTSYRHTGSAITPEPVVKVEGKTLTKDTDYELSYTNNTNIGNTATVTVAGKGNYSGTITKNFSIIDKEQQVINFAETTVSKTYGDSNFTKTASHTTGDGTVKYTSSNIGVATVNETTGEVTIKKAGTTTIKATAEATTDYAKAETTYTLTVGKKGLSFTATVENKEFDNIKNATVSNVEFTELVGSETLTKNTDYTVTAEFADVNVGNNKDVTVTITLMSTDVANNYELSATSYGTRANITAKTISDTWVSVDTTTGYTYNRSEIEPNVTVKNGSTTLVKDTDYTVEYSNNINAGTAKVKVTGKDNYSGVVEKEFTINKKTITPTIEDIPVVTYNGSNHTPELVVKDGTTTLVKNTDYTVEYTDNLNAGNADAEITAVSTSNYTFATTGKSFTIIKYTITESDVTLEYTSTAFDNTAKKPTVTLKMGSNVIAPLKYNVTYENNISVGTATVKVAIKEGDTNFTGSVNVQFNIVNKEEVTFYGIADNQEFTYTGAPRTPSVPDVTDSKVEKSTLEVSYSGREGTGYNSTTAPITAGTYTVTYKVPDSNPTYMGQVTYNFTIKKVQYAKVTISGATTFEYTGSPIRSSASGFINNQMTASGDIEKTDVGNYTITVSLNDKFNYAWADGSRDDLSLSWSITKATPTIAISNLSQKTGSIVEPTYTVSPAVTNGIVKVEYKLSTAEDAEYTDVLPTGAGTYSVRVSVTGDKNLNDKSEVATLEIKKKSTSSGGSGSSSTTKYEIKVTVGKGGTISPETTKVEKGDDEKFTIKADEGYEIEDVIVDGKSVGAVKSYKFENVKAKHTLKATFKKVEEKKDEEKKEDKAWKNPFNDVKEDDWYYKAIEFVNQKNLFSGMSKNEFGPKVEMTRGMFVTVLSKLNGGKIEGKLEFIDVDENAYYAKPVAWAYKKGIVGGVGNEMFAPDKEITREELAVMMYNYMQKTGTDLPAMLAEFPAFDDANEISSWAENAVRVMRATGLMNGKTGNKFDPKGKATRAEVATILMNFSK